MPASALLSGALPGSETVYVGLGANLGDARATLLAAVQELSTLPHTRLKSRSPLYRSAPVDAGGPDFINAVAAIETTLTPEALLAELQAIEQRHGRLRPYANAPRTLDLDLLLHGDQVRSTPVLTLPHPRLHRRAFVLQPLLDLAPELHAPGLGRLAAWLVSCSDQAIAPLPE